MPNVTGEYEKVPVLMVFVVKDRIVNEFGIHRLRAVVRTASHHGR
jgi:hypothetical protein